MINALFEGIDVNLNKTLPLSHACKWNCVSVKMGTRVWVIGNQS